LHEHKLTSALALKVAKERKSSVLASNAYHHRVDSLTAFVALLMIVGSRYLENAQWLDPVGGLVISLMVVQAGWGNTKDSLLELADVGIEEEMKEKVTRTATRALEVANTNAKDKVEVRQVSGIKSGQNYLIDIELAVPSNWTVEKSRGVEDFVRERLGAKVRGVKRVRVRFVPKEAEASDFMDEFIGADVSPTSSPEPEEAEHDHSHGDQHNGQTRKRK
jgi:divalent metal cation (Fe/Co/Zn/Cd) transporter